MLLIYSIRTTSRFITWLVLNQHLLIFKILALLSAFHGHEYQTRFECYNWQIIKHSSSLISRTLWPYKHLDIIHNFHTAFSASYSALLHVVSKKLLMIFRALFHVDIYGFHTAIMGMIFRNYWVLLHHDIYGF